MGLDRPCKSGSKRSERNGQEIEPIIHMHPMYRRTEHPNIFEDAYQTSNVTEVQNSRRTQSNKQTNKRRAGKGMRSRRNTYPSAILSSVTASCISTAVCSILYSTLSSSVPWSITSADRSLNSSASCAMDRAISVISLSRCCRSTAGASSSSCWSSNVDACRSPCA